MRKKKVHQLYFFSMFFLLPENRVIRKITNKIVDVPGVFSLVPFSVEQWIESNG